jgi:hypothetical protein
MTRDVKLARLVFLVADKTIDVKYEGYQPVCDKDWEY